MGLDFQQVAWMAGKSHDSSLLERHKSTIFINGLEGAAAQLEPDELAQFRHPDALGLEVRGNGPLHHLRDVTADTALLFGETRTVDLAARADAGASDATNTCHNKKNCGCGTRRMTHELNASRRILMKFSQSVENSCATAHFARFRKRDGCVRHGFPLRWWRGVWTLLMELTIRSIASVKSILSQSLPS